MLKIRIEFLDHAMLEKVLKTLSVDFEIVDQGDIREPQKKGSKWKFCYVELLPKL